MCLELEKPAAVDGVRKEAPNKRSTHNEGGRYRVSNNSSIMDFNQQVEPTCPTKVITNQAITAILIIIYHNKTINNKLSIWDLDIGLTIDDLL